MQVCDGGFTASCVGCCVSTLPALRCEEAIPRTSELEKRGSKGREGREERREGGREEGEEGGKDSSCSAKRSYSGAVFRQILEVHQGCSYIGLLSEKAIPYHAMKILLINYS